MMADLKLTDAELKNAIYALLLKSKDLPFEQQPTSTAIEETFEAEGIGRVKQCLEELQQERKIQGRPLHRPLEAQKDEEPPSTQGDFQTHVRTMPPRR
jgi:hypothetical protein